MSRHLHRGRLATLAALAAAVALPAPAHAAAPGTSCTPGRDLKYLNTTWLGRTWEYRIITSTFPSSLTGSAQTRDRAVERIRDGIRAWNEGRTDCHFRRFHGFQTKIVGTSGADPTNHEDGLSAIGFTHNLTCSGDPDVVGCETNRQLGGVPPVLTKAGAKEVPRESDVQFSADDPYTARRRTRGCSGRYDLWSLSAHEVGHVVGLGDLSGDAQAWQTMFGTSFFCQFRQRQLGRSDYIGLTRLYTRVQP
jgi:hypothetical protein